MILDLKCYIYPILRTLKFFLKSPKESFQTVFNACHLVQFQKILMKSYREEF